MGKRKQEPAVEAMEPPEPVIEAVEAIEASAAPSGAGWSTAGVVFWLFAALMIFGAYVRSHGGAEF